MTFTIYIYVLPAQNVTLFLIKTAYWVQILTFEQVLRLSNHTYGLE